MSCGQSGDALAYMFGSFFANFKSRQALPLCLKHINMSLIHDWNCAPYADPLLPGHVRCDGHAADHMSDSCSRAATEPCLPNRLQRWRLISGTCLHAERNSTILPRSRKITLEPAWKRWSSVGHLENSITTLLMAHMRTQTALHVTNETSVNDPPAQRPCHSHDSVPWPASVRVSSFVGTRLTSIGVICLTLLWTH